MIRVDLCTGLPFTSKTDVNIQEVGKIVWAMTELANTDTETVHLILNKYLYIKKLCLKMVPKLLTLE